MQNTTTYPIIKISRLLPYTNKKGETNAGCIPVDSDLYTELEKMKNGENKLIAEKVRAITDKDKRSAFKQSNLPSLAISGVFRKWRDTAHLVNHTGLLNIDIDGDHNPHIGDWSAIRDELAKLPHIVAAWLSVSGDGITLVVKIIPSQHKETFYYLSDYFSQVWGLRIDRGCNDVTRQRYTSFDPGCYINYNFDSIPTVEPTDAWRKQKATEPAREPITITGEIDSEINFLKAASDVETAKVPFVFEDKSKYFFLRALAARCNIISMSQPVVEELVIKHYRDKTNISTDDLLKPIKGIYKSYKNQHGTFEAINRRNAKEEKVKWILVDYLHGAKRPTPEQIAEIASENDLNIP
ncbi:MAG: BT4734/BF3469 family protein, partial [Candidatus Paceibacterales bacterium]